MEYFLLDGRENPGKGMITKYADWSYADVRAAMAEWHLPSCLQKHTRLSQDGGIVRN